MIKQQLITAEDKAVSSLIFSELFLSLDETKLKQIITAKIINNIMQKLSAEEELNLSVCIKEADTFSLKEKKIKKLGVTYSNEIKKLCINLHIEGRSLREISKKVGSSTATITRVAHWLHHGKGGYKLMLERLK